MEQGNDQRVPDDVVQFAGNPVPLLRFRLFGQARLRLAQLSEQVLFVSDEKLGGRP
jgi:hypothetical protein